MSTHPTYQPTITHNDLRTYATRQWGGYRLRAAFLDNVSSSERLAGRSSWDEIRIVRWEVPGGKSDLYVRLTAPRNVTVLQGEQMLGTTIEHVGLTLEPYLGTELFAQVREAFDRMAVEVSDA